MSLTFLAFGDAGWGDEILFGAAITFILAICGFLLGLVLATVFALFKLSHWRVLRVLGNAYTTVVRGVPELLVIYLFLFGSSSLIMAIASGAFGYEGYIELNRFTIATLAIMTISAAYSTEVIRGAFQSIPAGQFEAARALGLKPWPMFLKVVLPQAFRFALPGLGNVWQITLKETALVSVVGLAELMRMASVASGVTKEPFLFYGVAAVLYLVMTTFSSIVFGKAEKHFQKTMAR